MQKVIGGVMGNSWRISLVFWKREIVAQVLFDKLNEYNRNGV